MPNCTEGTLLGFVPQYILVLPGDDTSATIRYTLEMTLSARNHLAGKVVELQFGDVMAHVVVKVGENLVESVITRRSAEEMALKVGDTVAAVIKSTEVMLQKS
jgi:molybdopterin-binding protein